MTMFQFFYTIRSSNNFLDLSLIDRRLGTQKRCPWNQRQAQVDGRLVQRANSGRPVQPQIFFSVKLAGWCNQPLRKLGID
jgi:hypothetical protein